jgi:superfamily I DNA/RNA helicase
MPDFRFRLPSINDLTDLQQVAFYEKRPVLVTGGPGSGKTVVTIFRFLRQISDDKNALFFTYNRTLMSSIKGTLRQQADIRLPELNELEIEEVLKSKIASIYEWYGYNFHAKLSDESDEEIFNNFTDLNKESDKYSELFIDEAQDIRLGIINGAYAITNKISCGADRSQDLQGQYTEPADDAIFNLLNNKTRTIRQGLTLNFRNTKEIFEFARNFIPEDQTVHEIDTNELNRGEIPELLGNQNENEQLLSILEIIKQSPNSNIGILVHNRKQVLIIKKFLESNNYSCEENANEETSFSYYYSSMPPKEKKIVESKLKTPFILTFESCKGLEFDIVVLPFFEWSDIALNGQKYYMNEDKEKVLEFNANGTPKMWATPNHYYVAATRTRNSFYILYDRKPTILAFWKEENSSTSLFDANL